MAHKTLLNLVVLALFLHCHHPSKFQPDSKWPSDSSLSHSSWVSILFHELDSIWLPLSFLIGLEISLCLHSQQKMLKGPVFILIVVTITCLNLLLTA